VPRRYLLLDACVAINLAATGNVESIAQVLSTTFLIVDQAASEMGYLRDEVDGQLVQTPIDLNRYVTAGAVQLLSLNDGELDQYVALAAVVDDGEAATITIAASRGLLMATDDRKARRVCTEQGVLEPVRSLNILHSYADAASLNEESIRELLVRIRSRASFRPPSVDPDYKWWSSHVGEA